MSLANLEYVNVVAYLISYFFAETLSFHYNKTYSSKLIFRVNYLCLNEKKEEEIEMTTPRWTRNLYVKSIVAVLLIVFIIVTIVCLNHYDVLSSSSSASQDRERQELNSRSNSLKSLVAAWLKGEFTSKLFIEIFTNLVMKLMSSRHFNDYT